MFWLFCSTETTIAPQTSATRCIGTRLSLKDLEKRKPNLSEQVRNLFNRYKRIEYNVHIMRQAACLVINPNHGWYLCFPLIGFKHIVISKTVHRHAISIYVQWSNGIVAVPGFSFNLCLELTKVITLIQREIISVGRTFKLLPFVTEEKDHMSPVKRICVFEHSVMTNFNCACPAIQRGQGSGFLSEGSSWLPACMSEQRRFWRDCADAQVRLNFRCSHRR